MAEVGHWWPSCQIIYTYDLLDNLLWIVDTKLRRLHIQMGGSGTTEPIITQDNNNQVRETHSTVPSTPCCLIPSFPIHFSSQHYEAMNKNSYVKSFCFKVWQLFSIKTKTTTLQAKMDNVCRIGTACGPPVCISVYFENLIQFVITRPLECCLAYCERPIRF